MGLVPCYPCWCVAAPHGGTLLRAKQGGRWLFYGWLRGEDQLSRILRSELLHELVAAADLFPRRGTTTNPSPDQTATTVNFALPCSLAPGAPAPCIPSAFRSSAVLAYRFRLASVDGRPGRWSQSLRHLQKTTTPQYRNPFAVPVVRWPSWPAMSQPLRRLQLITDEK